MTTFVFSQQIGASQDIDEALGWEAHSQEVWQRFVAFKKDLTSGQISDNLKYWSKKQRELGQVNGAEWTQRQLIRIRDQIETMVVMEYFGRCHHATRDCELYMKIRPQGSNERFKFAYGTFVRDSDGNLAVDISLETDAVATSFERLGPYLVPNN